MMFMKKVLTLFICIFLLTGCDVTYNLIIDDDTFSEQIIIPFSRQTTTDEDITEYLKNKIGITTDRYENKYYNIGVETTPDFYNLIYDYKFDFEGFKKSFFVDICYPNMSIKDNEKEIIIKSGNGFRCLNPDNGVIADSAKINIKTSLEVIENNADSVSNNTYTWNIDYDNYKTREVNLKLKKDEVKKKYDFSFIIYILIILGLIGFIYAFVKSKFKNINNID